MQPALAPCSTQGESLSPWRSSVLLGPSPAGYRLPRESLPAKLSLLHKWSEDQAVKTNPVLFPRVGDGEGRGGPPTPLPQSMTPGASLPLRRTELQFPKLAQPDAPRGHPHGPRLVQCRYLQVCKEKCLLSAEGGMAARADGSAWPSRYWMERSWKQGSARSTAVARLALQTHTQGQASIPHGEQGQGTGN